ncbi:protein FAM185A [Musca vetustissima]|uniref:protein FAM185A n=1 Tax=Musca vetustissima TaxID=27455 RepID=UPI002AB6B01D|nr:protein FAM185A [Musca vetustissima]
MLTLRPVAPFLQRTCCSLRFYARPTTTTSKKSSSSPSKTEAMKKFVHQETLRYLSPTCNVKVISDIFLKVRSADVHEYPNGDVFIAQLHGGPAKNCPASMEVNVSDDENNVEVVVKKLKDDTGDFFCELEVPVKASLEATSNSGANISKIFGDFLKLKAENYISVSDVKAEEISVESVNGNVFSRGLLLGKRTKIVTNNNGHIILDKLQGDEILCKTDNGNITTNCCYVESSVFETNAGDLDLKNIHKTSQVNVQQAEGNLKMTGVHGNLNVNFNGTAMELQLSELNGENCIKSNQAKSIVINISDDIENNTSILANLQNKNSGITLDPSLQHLNEGLSENKQCFKWPKDKEQECKLEVNVNSPLTLGKSSWADMLRLKMQQNQKNNNNNNNAM